MRLTSWALLIVEIIMLVFAIFLIIKAIKKYKNNNTMMAIVLSIGIILLLIGMFISIPDVMDVIEKIMG